MLRALRCLSPWLGPAMVRSMGDDDRLLQPGRGATVEKTPASERG